MCILIQGGGYICSGGVPLAAASSSSGGGAAAAAAATVAAAAAAAAGTAGVQRQWQPIDPRTPHLRHLTATHVRPPSEQQRTSPQLCPLSPSRRRCRRKWTPSTGR
eukprot:gene23128-biopygen7256